VGVWLFGRSWVESRLSHDRLEELDWIAGRILNRSLFPANAGDDVVPKVDSSLA
jgi:hypothetical protein